jgi:hypothetical protein
MAARENQGLQIALIIFVMLAIILSVTTFIFYRNYKGAQVEAANSKESATKAQSAEREAQDERNMLLRLVGYAETDRRTDYEPKANAIIPKYNEYFKLNLADDRKSLNNLVDEMAKTINNKHKELVAAQQEIETQKKARDAEKNQFASALQVHTEDKDKAVAEKEAAKAAFIAQVAALSQSKDQAASMIAKKDQDLQQLAGTTAQQLKGMRDQLTKSQQVIEDKSQVIKDLTNPVPTVPDGKVAWVNQRDNIVYISVGSADGLPRRTTFSVFDKDANDASTAVQKGSIEVLNVRAPHMAEARILESSNSDPIVPGDIIYTPLWSPGQTGHFAIAGFIDFENDGASDLEKLKNLITYNGAVVDAEMDAKGKVVGQITPKTQMLILGSPPTERQEDLVKGYSQLNSEANALGVPSIKLDAFLNQIGYSVRPTAAGSGNNGQPRELRNPGRQADNTDTSGEAFRTRRPPEKNGNGAF